MLTLNFITADSNQKIMDVRAIKAHLASGLVKILPHHAPMIATVEPGKIQVGALSGIRSFDVSGKGLLKVERDLVTIVS